MRGFMNAIEMIEHGAIAELICETKEDPALLASCASVFESTPMIRNLWESYPAAAKLLLTELGESDQRETMIGILEQIVVKFHFVWVEKRYYVMGNLLFFAVWRGEHQLVEQLLAWGMDPDGANMDRGERVMRSEFSSESRWGKVRIRTKKNDFMQSVFDIDHDWPGMGQGENDHIITPLYLAELLGDQRMIKILKDAGACDMPAREYKEERDEH